MKKFVNICAALIGFGFILSMSPVYATSETINFGETLAGRTVCNGEVDSLLFVATPGDRVFVSMTACQDVGGSCSRGCCCFDQYLGLFDQAGALVAENSTGQNYNSCGWTARLNLSAVHVSSGGTNVIIVRDTDGFGGGYYSLSLQRLNVPSRVDSLHQGDNLLERLDSCGQLKTYVFSANAKDTVWIDMTPAETGSIDPRLELYDPQGRAVAIPGSGQVRAVLEQTGVYSVLAYSSMNEIGTYHLTYRAEATSTLSSTWGRVKAMYH